MKGNIVSEHNRRADDRRVGKLIVDVSKLKDQMAENTAITIQVRDILASFRIAASIAKWFTAICGAIAAGFAIMKGVRP